MRFSCRVLPAVTLAALAISMLLGFASPASLAAATPAACTNSRALIASVDQLVARRIYLGERSGTAVTAGLAHVTGASDLLRAVARDDQVATLAAVNRLVYHRSWHIVRLRVIRGGRVLADVGGPYVIAPVQGTLVSGGRVVGTFVMSLQDDVGYTKLESRFIGAPISVYRDGQLLMGTLAHAPATPPANGSSVTVRGRAYRVVSFTAAAFPTGSLDIVLYVGAPPASLAGASCLTVTTTAYGLVAVHLARRFTPITLRYRDFVGAVSTFTGAQIFVRVNSLQLAGTSPGPLALPTSGTVSYLGGIWGIYSFTPVTQARVYVLVRQASVSVP